MMISYTVSFIGKFFAFMPKMAKAIGITAGLLFVVAETFPAFAVDFNWTGASSSLIYDNGNASGNWNPSVPTGVQGNAENWIFPDATTLGAGSTTPSFDSGGIFTVGGASGGGITFAADAPAYTFTQTDPANIFNLAGSTSDNTSSDRGIITNSSSNKQTFNMDVISSRSTIDAVSGDIEFSAGHTFTTGGSADLSITGSNANSMSTIFQGDHNIYLNSNVVQTTTGNAGTNGQRGQLIYRGASTTPENAGALLLGDLGSYGGRITVDSTNGGVVRATHSNSFGIDGFTTAVGTIIGNGTTGDTSNCTVELDGSAGNLTIPESFRLGMRTAANNIAQMRNVAGNNTITGFVSLNTPLTGTSDSAYIESVAGKLTFAGTISDDRPSAISNLYLKGAGDFEFAADPTGYGIYQPTATTNVLNIDKSGAGTVTTPAGATIDYLGTTTIHQGSFIINGSHSAVLLDNTPATAGPYSVETNGTLGGGGSTVSTVSLAGTLAPGPVGASGTFTLGGLSLTGGTLDFQLNATNHTAGSGINDLIIDTDALDLTGGATLNVTGIGGGLTAGDYDLIQFTGGLTGDASNITIFTIPLATGLSASIVIDSDSVNLHIAAGLSGDYNGDGKVDAADYVIWRKDPASHGGTPAGYNTWRANFGTGNGAGSALSSGAAVPEPAGAMLMTFAVAVSSWICVSRRRLVL
jgi:hypothetical protein